ncbi:DUF4876 domain-containing protein [Sphingobacterium spiritivorum]|uniref:DUF4876 domain-containing protein n=1 Tax=Sphingobacterium spiritivorum ATCC 33861 TaxID=525373 RepID=D7VQE7_SPHSI|nr:DUF4876 domain-containing protein [Sphingobacterium spiritivorum]EFK55998.1 hypothetical protein HMPREF0766_13201 [Sphingobacterium spiritivorum ATCC 33861]QQT35869.1 DUF4876 domain-containing protein [Sphingobacterium spiritivorum]WQD32596.1 DUF4876 domain-containing protein [Sphingobacterium spiritivorum]SUJ11381.1 Uncharacterised protein [Sphingobacterium spiritivorum]
MLKNNILFLMALLLITLGSCKKADNNLVAPVSLNIKPTAVDGTSSFEAKGATVKITNLSTGAIFNATADASGNASFASITPGTYSVNAVLEVTAADYSAKTGVYTEENVFFNGSVDRLDITSDLQRDLPLVVGKVGDWVFKQIYYAGSNATRGASFRDVFLEVYNNSNQVLYADSLYFGQADGKNNNNEGTYYIKDTRQFDWSQSIGMILPPGLDANKDYIYAYTLFMIPSDGTGKKYPVQPGESKIIAATAVNHTGSYSGNDGQSVAITDPTLTVDLSNADFETYLVNYLGGTPYKYDVDNVNVPNVDVLFVATGNDMILKANGRDAVFLYKKEAGGLDPKNFPEYAEPDVRQITATTNKYRQIPVSGIVDAVEFQHPLENSRVPKRLPLTLDATRTHVPGGQYSSQSLIRKTAKTVNGRRILQDTNNSEADFSYFDRPNVSKSASSFLN